MSQEITSQHVEALSARDTSDYWWYAVRQGLVDRVLATERPDGMAYLDLGCGAGGVMQSVVERFAPDRAVGVDGTQEAVDIAAARGLDARYADLRKPLELPFAPDTVTCLDVLEHLEDPVLALQHLREAATDDVVLVVTVPALPSLHSAWDDLCGHYRRYTRRSLIEHLTAGGWRVERCRYAFSYCVPPAWLQRRVLKTVQEVEFPPVSPLMNTLLTWAGKFEAAVGNPFPFGTSVVAVARPVDSAPGMTAIKDYF